MVSLRCPRCLSPIPAKAGHCAVCGADPHAALPPFDQGAAVLAPRRPTGSAGQSAGRTRTAWLAPLGLAGLALVMLLGLVGLGLLAAQAGLGGVAWPALLGIGCVALVGAALQVERRRRALAQLVRAPEESVAPSDLDLIYLFAARFALPGAGPDSFRPPLQQESVRADEAAWRAVAATLLDLAEQDVLELELRALPTPERPVQVVAVRLVRPVPPGDEFAARLLRPLARRGVGASTTASELVSQMLIMHRHPARSLLESAHGHLVAAQFYQPGERAQRRGLAGLPGAWLRAALFRPLAPNPERIASAQPALDALETRLASWDEHDPELVAALRDEILAAFVRARARARQGMSAQRRSPLAGHHDL
jgi:hypothetical protein